MILRRLWICYKYIYTHTHTYIYTRTHMHSTQNLRDIFFWWVLQHCTGFARLVWGRLGVHLSFHLFKSICVFCVFLLSSCPFLDILHCLPRAVGVPLESALNLVSRMSPCGAHAQYTEFEGCLLDSLVVYECSVYVDIIYKYTYIHIYI